MNGTKAPKTVNEVYVEAKSWVHVTQVPHKSGGGASFATTNGDGIMRFNSMKKTMVRRVPAVTANLTPQRTTRPPVTAMYIQSRLIPRLIMVRRKRPRT